MQKILVIDDEPAIQELLGLALRGANYQVQTCSRDTYALKVQAAWNADLILCDVDETNLKKKEKELLSALRQACPSTPILAVLRGDTAGNSQADETIKDLGATAVIQKPFTISEILDCAARLL